MKELTRIHRWTFSGYKYLLTGAAVVCLSIVALLFNVHFVGESHAKAKPPASATPDTYPPNTIAALVAKLGYAPFSITGLAFFDDRLYVASNIGLLEIESGHVSKLYRWHGDNSPVYGPWIDRAHRALWIQDAETGHPLKFDGSRWTRVELPRPPNGHLRRGDILAGFRGVGNFKDFWLEGAAGVWRYQQEPAQWITEATPETRGSKYHLRRALALEDRLLFIASSQWPWQFHFKDDPTDIVYQFQGNWSVIPNPSHIVFYTENAVATADAAYICSEQNQMVKVSRSELRTLEAPGPCETVAVTQHGTALVSVKGKGIYEVSDTLTLRTPYPYPDSEGKHWSYLAENKGVIAYATSSMPAEEYAQLQTGSTSVWLSSGSELHQVDLGIPPASARTHATVLNVAASSLLYFDPKDDERTAIAYRRHGSGSIPRKLHERIVTVEDGHWAANSLIVMCNKDFSSVVDEVRKLVIEKIGVENEQDSSDRPIPKDPEPTTPQEHFEKGWGGSWPPLGEGFRAFDKIDTRGVPREYQVTTKTYNHLKSATGRSQLRIRLTDGAGLLGKDVAILQIQRRDFSREWARDAHVFGGVIVFPWKEDLKFFLITDTEVALVEQLGKRLPGTSLRYFVPEHREFYHKADPAILESLRQAAREL